MPIANGSEEMEVVIIVDVLRRAGFEVIVASVEKELQILASRNVKIVADQFLSDVPVSNVDMIILPVSFKQPSRSISAQAISLLTSTLPQTRNLKPFHSESSDQPPAQCISITEDENPLLRRIR